MQPRRHEKVARAFGARGGEDRRLELEEFLLLHPSAQRIDNLTTQHDVLVKLLASQVEEPIFKPRILGIGLVAKYRQRQVPGRPQHLDRLHIDLNEPGRHFGVFGAARALAHLAVDADDEFRAQLLRIAEGGRIRIDDALGEAVMVAQIDEQQAAVVADAMAPSGKPDVGAVLGEGQGAAGMGSVAMHDLSVFFASGGVPPLPSRNQAEGKARSRQAGGRALSSA